MSYDVCLMADLDGENPVEVGELGWNYTYNCSGMWREAGFNIGEMDGMRAGDAAKLLEAGLERMKADPERFKAMNPSNGWGSYESSIPCLGTLLRAFLAAPDAIVRVS